MVRNYKKKGRKRKYDYTDGQLKLAIECVKNGQSIKATAAQFGVTRITFQNQFKDVSSSVSSGEKAGFQRLFTDEQETALSECIIDMEARLKGLCTKELREIAYDFAVELKVSHPFSRETGMAGKDWMMSFMKRHKLSNRKAQNTSAARANEFNKEAVGQFFCLLKEIQDKYNFPPSNIWNVDETFTSAVPKSSTRIIARKGRKQVGGKTSAERGENVTAEVCMSASGVFMPLMLVFPHVKPNLTFLDGKPADSWAEWDKSGYVNANSFLTFLKKFIAFSKASKDNPQLLLLDGHDSHVKNLAVAKLAKENGVVILCFPPHCTHRMQPLDVGFMKLLSMCYAEEVKAFQRSGSLVQMKNIFSLYGKAWQKAAKVETAVNAFKTTGIVPLNVNIFDHHFQSPNSSSLTLESSIDEEKIEQCKQLISNILTPKQTKVKEGASVDSSLNCNEVDIATSQSPLVISQSPVVINQGSAEAEVKVPFSMLTNFLEAAKPILSLLNNHQFSSSDNVQVTENLFKKTSNKSTKRNRGTAAMILTYKNWR